LTGKPRLFRLQSDIDVRPTLAGIRTGRDEVLEEAIQRILGASTSRAEVEALVDTAYGRVL